MTATISFKKPIVKVFTTAEDWVFDFRFLDADGNAIDQTGATFVVQFVNRRTGVAEAFTLATGGANPLTLGGAGSNELSGVVPAATTPDVAGEWSADLIRTKDGRTRRYIPCIIRQVKPGDVL